ncbi:gliding motility-associated C-terminal domain-containing protein [bacterium]|nr:gliding motility-associated C-terminal domain-containing protein [bacterium]
MKSKVILMVVLLLVLVGELDASFTNLGTDFFFCYPANAFRDSLPDTLSRSGLLILTSSYNTTGTVRNFDGTYSVPFNIPANGTFTIEIDSSFWITTTETVENKGLRIQSDHLISAYFLSFKSPGATNDMALLFPVPSLGTEYYTMCYQANLQTISPLARDRGPSMLAIVATEDNTHITITPTADTEGGHPAGTPFSITLDQYQTYQILAHSPLLGPEVDLTGTRITSDKPIGVISGNTEAVVPDNIWAADYLIEMMPPLTAWGENFIVFPVKQRASWTGDVLRVLASEDNTHITVQDGASTINVTLDEGEYWELNGGTCSCLLISCSCTDPLLEEPRVITSDKPILVAQYMVGAQLVDALGVNPIGDPAFMLISPIEQYAPRYIFLVPNGYQWDYINVTIPTGHEGSLLIDGGAPGGVSWFDIPVLPYRGAKIRVTDGSHIIEADTSFLLAMYGFDSNYASYATVAGQNLDIINPEYDIRKYSLTPTVISGTQATYRLVIHQTRGDSSFSVTITDTLPPGFHFGTTPPTYEIYGAIRTSVVDPSPGDNLLTFGTFEMVPEDSVVITFTVDIDYGVEGLFDNPVGLTNSTGPAGSNFGGTRDTIDDVEVLLPTFNMEIITPDSNSFVACVDQEISMILQGITAPVNPISILVSIQQDALPPETLTLGANLTYTNDTLAYHPPTGRYISGETYTFCLIHAEDTLGSPAAPLPFCWSFVTDFDPPVVYDFSITPGDTIMDSLDVISFILEDSIAGLDPSTIEVTINGVDYSRLITFRNDSVIIDPVTLGINWFDTTEVEICVSALDYTTYCREDNQLDTCITWTVFHSIPMVYIVRPMPDSVTSCRDSSIIIAVIDTLSDIDPSSISLSVNRVIYTIGANLSLFDTLLIFTPPAPGFRDGDTVNVSLLTLSNVHGVPADSLPLSWTFYVDLSGPDFSNLYPPPDTVIRTSTPGIHLNVTDNLAGVDPSLFVITVNGRTLSPGEYSFRDSLLTLTGVIIDSTETVTVCIEAGDLAMYCGPNISDTCWSFVVTLDGPFAYPVNPLPDSISACDPQVIIIHLEGTVAEIEPDSILLYVNGAPYTIRSAYLTYSSETNELVFSPPAGFFSDGETVDVNLAHAHDMYGTDLPEPLIYSFTIDYSPPVVWGILPEGVVSEASPDISFFITDRISGLAEVHLVINGTDTFDVLPSDSEVVFSCEDSGLAFSSNDTVQVCIVAYDSPDYCGPNVLDSCWSFIVNLERPEAEIIEPFIGAITACDDQGIILLITSENGVDTSSIIFVVSADTSRCYDDNLTYDFSTGELIFSPIESYTDGDSISFCLIKLADTLGHMLLSPVCGQFIVDLTPPAVYSNSPEWGDIVADEHPRISFCLFDSIAGVDSVIAITVNGVEHSINTGATFTDSCFEFTPTEAFSDGDTVVYCLNFRDDPDYCPPNEGVFCDSFIVDMMPPDVVILTPHDGWFSACDDQGVIFTISDIHGVDPSSVVININGTDYTTDSTGLSFTGAEFVWTPAGLWSSGDVVRACVTSASDSVGNGISAPVCITFTLDLEPPVLTSSFPTDMDTITDPSPTVRLQIEDTLSGVDGTAFEININGDSYEITHSGIFWDGAELSVNLDSFGYHFIGGDSVVICITSQDTPDTCAPNIGTDCTTFFIMPGGPTASFVTPPADCYSSCEDQNILIEIYDEEGVDTSTILLEITSSVSGVDSFTLSSSELSLGAGTNLRFTPSILWEDAETLDVCLISASDIIGNELEDAPVCREFYIDLTPPVIWNISPVGMIATIDTFISFNLLDSLSGVSDFTVEVNGTLFPSSSAFVDIAGDSVTVDIIAAGIDLHGGDTFTVCVHAEDSPCICEPNELDSCWTFFIESTGPVASIVSPAPSIFFACDEDEIIISITDSNGVDTSTIILEVNGTEYHWGDSELSWVDDSLLVFTPDIPFEDNDTVDVSLIRADDILGNPLSSSVLWRYFVDRQPPVYSAESPIDGGISTDSLQIISIVITDSGSGVDESTITVIINGTPFDITSPALTYSGDTLYFDPEDAGIVFNDGDTVMVCLEPVSDMPDTCGPNMSDEYCWEFYVRLFGPEATLIQYPDSSFVACEPESQFVIIEINDIDGVDGSTIRLFVNDVEYTTDSSQLTFDEPELTFTPSPAWEDGDTVEIFLSAADDIYGAPLAEPIRATFIMDLSPPYFDIIEPALPVVNDTLQDIVFIFGDSLSGVNLSTVHFTVNGTEYLLDAMVSTGDTFYFIPESLGIVLPADTIAICIYAEDSPDWCSPNILDSCTNFIVSVGGPVAYPMEPLPNTVSACDDQRILIHLFDVDGVNAETILLAINGDTFDIDDVELEYSGDTLIFTPSVDWVHNETVFVQLLEAQDIYGNSLQDTLDYQFQVDLIEPVISSINPPEGATIAARGFILSFRLEDIPAGIDTSSFQLIVGEDTVLIGSDCLSLSYETSGERIAAIDVEDSCLSGLTGGDTVFVCLDVSDAPDYCSPNELRHCWNYTIESGGPTVEIIAPFNGAYSACEQDTIILYIHDDNGVDTSSITILLNGEEFNFGTDREIFSYRSDTLYFAVPIELSDGDTIRISLVRADDMLGNPIPHPVSWFYITDYSPPRLILVEPEPEQMVRDHTPEVTIFAADNLSGIDPTSILININGEALHFPQEGVTFSPIDSAFSISTEILGIELPDTVRITAQIYDIPDYCDAHIAAAEWYFLIEPVAVCDARPNPFSPNSDGYNDRVFFSYPNMHSEEAVLSIFDMRNVLVYEARIPPQEGRMLDLSLSWDGTDKAGKKLPPGVYIYVIQVKDKVICNGTVILAR